MDKTQLLALIREKIQDKTVTRDEVVAAASDEARGGQAAHLTNIFYIIGALIAVVGAVILVATNWNEIGFAGRIVVSAGIALATYVGGLYLNRPEHRVLSQVFFAITAALAPVGVAVIVRQLDMEFTPAVHVATGLSLALLFAVALWHTRRNVLVLFTLGYATWAFLAAIAQLFDVTGLIGKWTSITAGISYLSIAYFYHTTKAADTSAEHKEKRAVENSIYGLGTIGILAPAMSFGGLGDLVAVLLIFAAFYLSVYVKSRAMLIVGALFLIAHIIKITSKYFAESISWPIALIFVGFMVIAIGYATLYINRKFLSSA